MKILLTGGTGLIGRHLIPRLLELGHSVTVSTRHPDTARARLDPRVTLWRDFEGHHHLNDIDAVINLAGEPIADKRWTAEQKQRLCHSRWDLTQRLVGLIHASDTPPSVLISGSAIGYYGDLGEVVVTEKSHRTMSLPISCAPAGSKLPAKRKASAPASACCAPAWYWLRGAVFSAK